MNRIYFIVFLVVFIPLNQVFALNIKSIDKFIGDKDALIISDKNGNIVFSKNAENKLIPASILKVFTALVGIHYLGLDYRFTTDFYLDKDLNLKIKGYGDPLFVSEILNKIAEILKSKNLKFNDLILDDSYFTKPITIDGVGSSDNPYDAPNGALCANFNTIAFKIADGKVTPAEPQTPIIPFALKLANLKYLNINTDIRITLSHENDAATFYAGHLFVYFLEKSGIKFDGKIKIGKVNKEDKLIYTYVSKFSLQEVIDRLLSYSNNFIANQIFIASGAKAFGSPGNIEKGVKASKKYSEDILNIKDMEIAEGSGISRKNKISVKNFLAILEQFEPYKHLMNHEENVFFKTGTLTSVSTRAGYIESSNKKDYYRFVLMINSSNKSAKDIMPIIAKNL